MDMQRQRKLQARARRQESLKSQGITAEKTIVQAPIAKPKELISKDKKVEAKKEIVKKTIKSHEIAEVVKRGRGRPPKAISEVNNKTITKKNLVGKKTIKGKEKK